VSITDQTLIQEGARTALFAWFPNGPANFCGQGCPRSMDWRFGGQSPIAETFLISYQTPRKLAQTSLLISRRCRACGWGLPRSEALNLNAAQALLAVEL